MMTPYHVRFLVRFLGEWSEKRVPEWPRSPRSGQPVECWALVLAPDVRQTAYSWRFESEGAVQVVVPDVAMIAAIWATIDHEGPNKPLWDNIVFRLLSEVRAVPPGAVSGNGPLLAVWFHDARSAVVPPFVVMVGDESCILTDTDAIIAPL